MFMKTTADMSCAMTSFQNSAVNVNNMHIQILSAEKV